MAFTPVFPVDDITAAVQYYNTFGAVQKTNFDDYVELVFPDSTSVVLITMEAAQNSRYDVFKDQSGHYWTSTKNENVRSCKLCSLVANERHAIDLCSDPESLRWMEIHQNLLSNYDKKCLWYALDERCKELNEFTSWFTTNTHLQPLWTDMKRFLAVLRWAQVAFCVNPHLISTTASRLYEDSYDSYGALATITIARAHAPTDMSPRIVAEMEKAAQRVAKLLGRLIGGIGVLRQPHHVLDVDHHHTERAMDRAIMKELMFWKNYGK